MAGELEGYKPLSGLLSGLAQNAFHGNSSITEELLHSQLYPEVPPEEFRPFLAKMRGILKVLWLGLAALPPSQPQTRPRPRALLGSGFAAPPDPWLSLRDALCFRDTYPRTLGFLGLL